MQAEDDSGRVSEITSLSKATVSINTESVGQLPVVRMTEPVPGGFGDNFPDYSYGSELFINVEAFDPDGDPEYVRIYLNGELLGEAEGRSGNTYVYKWSVEQLDVDRQSFVIQAAAKDNDGNIVRSSHSGLTAANYEEKPPEVNVDGVFIDAEGVKIRALARSVGGSFSSGISRVQFFANGVTLDALSGATAFLADGFQEYVYNWTPTQPGVYSFYAMAVGGVFRMGDHYTMSDPFFFEITQENIDGFSDQNVPPTIALINPGENTLPTAVAKAELGELIDETDANFTKLVGVKMQSFGYDYAVEPEVVIYGGGGSGAEANATIRMALSHRLPWLVEALVMTEMLVLS